MSDHLMSNKSMHTGAAALALAPAVLGLAAMYAGIMTSVYVTTEAIKEAITQDKENFYKMVAAVEKKWGTNTLDELSRQMRAKWPEKPAANVSSAIKTQYEKDRKVISDFRDHFLTWRSYVERAAPEDLDDLEREASDLQYWSGQALASSLILPVSMPGASAEVSTTNAQVSKKSSNVQPMSSKLSQVSSTSQGDPEVRTAQEILTTLGFDPKGIDGKLGPNTKAAIRAFQAKNGLAQTGTLDPETMQRLRSMAPTTIATSASEGLMSKFSTPTMIAVGIGSVALLGGLAYYFLREPKEPVEG